MISTAPDRAPPKRLILDELFDLSLYEALREVDRATRSTSSSRSRGG